MQLALFPIIDILAAAVHLGVGIHVFSLDRRACPNRIFGGLAFLFAYWSLMTGLYTAAPTQVSAGLLYLAAGPSWIAAPFVFHQFCLRLTARERSDTTIFGVVSGIVGAAIVAIFIARIAIGPLTASGHALGPLGWSEIRSKGAWNIAFTLYYLLFCAAGIVNLAYWGRRVGGTARKQARVIIMTGLVTLLLLTLAVEVLPLSGVLIPPPGPVLIILWTFGIAYAINRYRFMSLSAAASAADIVRSMSELLLLVSEDGKIQVANPAAALLLGSGSEGGLLGKTAESLFPGQSAIKSLIEAKDGEEWKTTHEFSYTTADGRCVTLSGSAVVLRDVDGDRVGVGLIMRDITQERTAQEQLQYLATHDALTGLPNRALLREALTIAVAHAKRGHVAVGVLLLDLDHFKHVNDTMGHLHGDRLLLEVAARLGRLLRESDVIGRLGGDEFLVVLSEMKSPDDAGLAARRIIECFRQPVIINGEELNVTCSIGISAYPADGDTVDALLKNADIAMYRAKEQRNVFSFFTAPLQQALARRMAMEEALRHAIQRDELGLVFQPIFDTRTRLVSGIEALLRWNSTQWGSLTVSEFLLIAEKTGLTPSLDEWTLRRACLSNSAWQQEGLAILPVAVNVSARTLCRPGFIQVVHQTLEDTGLAASHLQLEISEGSLNDSPDIESAIRELERFGVKTILDNFGTGGCSLAKLFELRFSALKIDRTLLADICTNPAKSLFILSIVELAHNLGMEVAAGGVETEEQLALLRRTHTAQPTYHGCDRIQGFLLSKPLGPEAARELLQKDRAGQSGQTAE